MKMNRKERTKRRKSERNKEEESNDITKNRKK